MTLSVFMGNHWAIVASNLEFGNWPNLSVKLESVNSRSNAGSVDQKFVEQKHNDNHLIWWIHNLEYNRFLRAEPILTQGT